MLLSRLASTILFYNLFNVSLALLYKGEVSTFNVAPNATSGGNAVVNTIYSTCVYYDVGGEVLSTGHRCVTTLVNYMVQALASAAETYTVVDVSSGPGMARVYSHGSNRRRDAKGEYTGDGDSDGSSAWLMESANVALSKRSPELRATHIARSLVHDTDGLATRFNVYGSDSALIAHTNGSHASASFGSDSKLHERAFLRTNFQYFTFGGVNGIKMQARGLNGSSTPAYVSDLQTFASNFANITDTSSNRAPFQEHDSWDFEVCDTSRRSLFYGKIVAEKDRPGNDYEEVTPIGCGSTAPSYNVSA